MSLSTTHRRPCIGFAPRSRAFTLVEILMVVLILGIASTVIIPQLGSRDDLLASAAARQILSDLTYAQNSAITSQAPVYVVFTSANGAATGGSYSVCKALPATGTNVLTHPVTKNPWTMQFGSASPSGTYSRVGLSVVNFDSKSTLMFDETGAPYSLTSSGTGQAALGSGSLAVVCNGYTLTITVQPLTGTLTVQ